MQADDDQYEIKEIVPQRSSLGMLFLGITRFIVAPFLIGASSIIGIGAGKLTIGGITNLRFV